MGLLRAHMSIDERLSHLHHPDGRRRPGFADPGPAGFHRRRHRRLQGRHRRQDARQAGLAAWVQRQPADDRLGRRRHPGAVAGPADDAVPAGFRPGRRRPPGSASTPEHAELAAAVPVVQPPDDSAAACCPRWTWCGSSLGYGLLELASGGGSSFRTRSSGCAGRWRPNSGFVLPSVRIQDNVELDPYNYAFALKEIPAGTGELRPLMMLAISPGDQAPPLPGESTTEPTFGLPACWIAPALADQARSANWTVVDPATVLTTHLAEVVKENIAEFLSYTETQKLLAGLPQDQQKLVADLVPVRHHRGRPAAGAADAAGGADFHPRHANDPGGGAGSLRQQFKVRRLDRRACADPAVAADQRKPDRAMPAMCRLSFFRRNGKTRLAAALVGPPEDRQLALGAGQAAGVPGPHPDGCRSGGAGRREAGAADQHACPHPCAFDRRPHPA